MAYITIVSGGAQPVFATDVLNGNVAGTANAAAQTVTNFQGPKLDFFSLVANAALTTAGVANANGFLSNTLTAIQQTTTVAMYQVQALASTDALSVAVYPTGAANTATILSAAQGANATGGLNIGWTAAYGNAIFYTNAVTT